jgi:hypothetical protein
MDKRKRESKKNYESRRVYQDITNRDDTTSDDCSQKDKCRGDCCQKDCSQKECQRKCNSDCGRKKPSNTCCNEFGIAIGEIIKQTAALIEAEVIGALGRGIALDVITPRLAAFQTIFYLPLLCVIREAFMDSCKILGKCCFGYADGITNAAIGFTQLAIFNAFNTSITLGDPSNPMAQPGTVVQNLRILLAELMDTIKALRKISRKCE